MSKSFMTKHSTCTCSMSPLTRRKSNAPSRKKSLGYYAKVNKKGGTGSKAGGGMTAKGVAKYRRDNPGSKLKTAVTTPPSKLKRGSKAWKRRQLYLFSQKPQPLYHLLHKR